MNKERMLKLADLLDTVKPNQFKMKNWFGRWVTMPRTHGDEKEWLRYSHGEYRNAAAALGTCGTTACVAGWALAVAYPDPIERGCHASIPETTAKDYLELAPGQADWLFMGTWSRHPSPLIGEGTPQEAAQAIRAMVEADGIPLDFKLA